MQFAERLDAMEAALRKLVEDGGLSSVTFPEAVLLIQQQKRIIRSLRQWGEAHDKMYKACLDATILLSDPDFNSENRNDLLSTMRDVVTTCGPETLREESHRMV